METDLRVNASLRSSQMCRDKELKDERVKE